jgi:hypothetical protein
MSPPDSASLDQSRLERHSRSAPGDCAESGACGWIRSDVFVSLESRVLRRFGRWTKHAPWLEHVDRCAECPGDPHRMPSASEIAPRRAPDRPRLARPQPQLGVTDPDLDRDRIYLPPNPAQVDEAESSTGCDLGAVAGVGGDRDRRRPVYARVGQGLAASTQLLFRARPASIRSGGRPRSLAARAVRPPSFLRPAEERSPGSVRATATDRGWRRCLLASSAGSVPGRPPAEVS